MAIEIDDFLKDIDPDNVCGDDLQYDPVFIELEREIKGKPEQQMGDTVVEAEPGFGPSDGSRLSRFDAERPHRFSAGHCGAHGRYSDF